MNKCEETFESAVNEHKSNIAKDMAEFGEHKRIKKLHDDVDSEAHNYEWYFTKGAQSRQVEIDNLIIANAEMKSRLNDAYTNGQSAMYAVKQKEIEKLKAEISIGKEDVSIMTMIHGTCDCGTAWQPILSDKQGFNKLHCFACGNNRYESKEFFGDCEQGE